MPPLNNVGPMDLEAGDLVRDHEDEKDYIIDSLVFGAVGTAVVYGISAYSSATRTWMTDNLDKIGVDRIKKNNGMTAAAAQAKYKNLSEAAKAALNIPSSAPIKDASYYDKLDKLVRDLFLVGDDLSKKASTPYTDILTQVGRAIQGHTNFKFSSETIFKALTEELGDEYESSYLIDLADSLSSEIEKAFGKKYDVQNAPFAPNAAMIDDILFPEKGQKLNRSIYGRVMSRGINTLDYTEEVDQNAKSLLDFLGSKRVSEPGPNLRAHPLLKGVGNYLISEKGYDVGEEALARIYENYSYYTGGKNVDKDTRKVFREAAKRDIAILKKASKKSPEKLEGLSELGLQLMEDELFKGEKVGILEHIRAFHKPTSYYSKYQKSRKSTFNKGYVDRLSDAFAPNAAYLRDTKVVPTDSVLSVKKHVLYNNYLRNKKVTIGGKIYDLRTEQGTKTLADALEHTGGSNLLFRPEDLAKISENNVVNLDDILKPHENLANDLRDFGMSLEGIEDLHAASKGMGIDQLDSTSHGVVSFRMPDLTRARRAVDLVTKGNINSLIAREVGVTLKLEGPNSIRDTSTVYRVARQGGQYNYFSSLESIYNSGYSDINEVAFGRVKTNELQDFISQRGVNHDYLVGTNGSRAGWQSLAARTQEGTLQQVLAEGLQMQQAAAAVYSSDLQQQVEQSISYLKNLNGGDIQEALQKAEQNTRFAFLLVGGTQPIILRSKAGGSIQLQLMRADRLLAGDPRAGIMDIETSSHVKLGAKLKTGTRTGLVDEITLIGASGLEYLQNQDDPFDGITTKKAARARTKQLVGELKSAGHVAITLDISASASAKTRAEKLINFVDSLDTLDVVGSHNFADFEFIDKDLAALADPNSPYASELYDKLDSQTLQRIKTARVDLARIAETKGLATEIIPMVSNDTKGIGFSQEALSRVFLKRGEIHESGADVVHLGRIIHKVKDKYNFNRNGRLLDSTNIDASVKTVQMLDGKFASQYGSHIHIQQVYQVVDNNGTVKLEMKYVTPTGVTRTETITPDQLRNVYEGNRVIDMNRVTPADLVPNVETVKDKVQRMVRSLNPHTNYNYALSSSWTRNAGGESQSATLLRSRMLGDMFLDDNTMAKFRGLSEHELDDAVQDLLGKDIEKFKKRVLAGLKTRDQRFDEMIRKDPNLISHSGFWETMFDSTREVVKQMSVNDIERKAVGELFEIDAVKQLAMMAMHPEAKNMDYDATLLHLFGMPASQLGVNPELQKMASIKYSIGFGESGAFAVSQTLSHGNIGFDDLTTQFMGQTTQYLARETAGIEDLEVPKQVQEFFSGLTDEERLELIDKHNDALLRVGLKPGDDVDIREFVRQNSFDYAQAMQQNEGEAIFGSALRNQKNLGDIMTRSVQAKLELLQQGTTKDELQLFVDGIHQRLQDMQGDKTIGDNQFRVAISTALKEEANNFLEDTKGNSTRAERLELLRGVFEDSVGARIESEKALEIALAETSRKASENPDAFNAAMEAARDSYNVQEAYNTFNNTYNDYSGGVDPIEAAKVADAKRKAALADGARTNTGGTPPVNSTERQHEIVAQAVNSVGDTTGDAMRTQHSRVMKLANNFVGAGAIAGFSVAILGAMMAAKDYDPEYIGGNLGKKSGAGHFGTNAVAEMPGSNNAYGNVLTPESARNLFSLDVDINMHSDNAAQKDKIVKEVYNILNQTMEYRSVEHTRTDSRKSISAQDVLNRYL